MNNIKKYQLLLLICFCVLSITTSCKETINGHKNQSENLQIEQNSTIQPSITPSILESQSELSEQDSTVTTATQKPQAEESSLTTPSQSPQPAQSPTSNNSLEKCFKEYDKNNPLGLIIKTTLKGKIFDDFNNLLDSEETIVIVRALDERIEYERATSGVGGEYAFNGAPPCNQVEIIASLPGYTTRSRVVFLDNNPRGKPGVNRFDIGNDGHSTQFGASENALSDKPEVISVSPGKDSILSTLNPIISLTFSEPMDRASVEKNIRLEGTQEYISEFQFSWKNNDTEISLSLFNDLKKDRFYSINLKGDDGLIKDKKGNIRGEDYFKLNYREGSEEKISFYTGL